MKPYERLRSHLFFFNKMPRQRQQAGHFTISSSAV